jgi:tripartite-type tricarboxylate transporter receptor subunit TctC
MKKNRSKLGACRKEKKMKSRIDARFLVLLALFWTAMGLSASPSWAIYPEKPITFIMPWPAGGGTDTSGRPLIEAASRILGQPIVIEYHPGGSTIVGMNILKNRKPDGYTIGQTTLSATISQHMRKVPVDLVKDFSYIMQYAEYSNGLTVRSDSPWKTLKEFLDYCKANPGKIRYSATGPSSPPALIMATLGKRLGIQWTLIPFEGGPPALTALLGGHVEAYTGTMHVKPHVLAGRVRLLCAYEEKRAPSFPDLPTLQELGYPITCSNFLVLLAPKGIPPDVLETLHRAFKKAMDDPAFKKGCQAVDHVIVYRNPEETTRHIKKMDEEIAMTLKELKLIKAKK